MKRSGDEQENCLTVCPRKKFQYLAVDWHIVVNVIGYTLFVTSQHDVILMFGVGLAKFVDTACTLFYTHSPYPLL